MAVILCLFGGKGRISGIMGDFEHGLQAMRNGLAADAAPRIGNRPDQGNG